MIYSVPADRGAMRSKDSQFTETLDAMKNVKLQHWLIMLLAVVIGLVMFFCLAPVPNSNDVDEAPPPPPPVVPAEPAATSDQTRAPPPTAPVLPEIPFTDITEEAGIDFVHQNGAAGEMLLPETMGSGAAFFDYDNDGDQDLLLVNATAWPHAPSQSSTATSVLYQNDGHGHFEDVSAAVGLNLNCYGTGVAVGDFDNDGWRDLFIAAVGRDHLFRNNGGEFEEVTTKAGVAGEETAYSSSCGWWDYDNDGDLDLFVCHYIDWSRASDLAQNFSRTGGMRDYGPPLDFGGTFSKLFRNDGAGQFSDVTAAAGIEVRSSTGRPLGKSLGLIPVDVDSDGWLDLIVANDTVRNFLFHNQQDGTFLEIGVRAGIAFDNSGNARGGMGIDAGFLRNDTSLAVTIGDFANEASALFVARRPLLFADEATISGLGAATLLDLTFGTFYFDADLDGRLDILAANGHISSQIERVQTSQTHAQAPQLFWNAGPGAPLEFVPLTAKQCSENFVKPIVGRGAAYADIDGDGDQDVLMTATGARPRLLRNDQQTGHHWLRLKLVGTRTNRDAIGARVDVHVGDTTFTKQVMPTRSYLSQMELPVTFGLGARATIDKVNVHWPGGVEQVVDDPQVDALNVVTQPR
ncbi:ASPIC and UnbV [Symmachiella dynata]|uniref:ASPIC and UnbV n=2 Tax=Symmachiella dynata TaxID=2527995 RepID=A0A517ZGK9_9PLAN|nr:ASPIC and UnbV [Symmachiella dynata]